VIGLVSGGRCTANTRSGRVQFLPRQVATRLFPMTLGGIRRRTGRVFRSQSTNNCRTQTFVDKAKAGDDDTDALCWLGDCTFDLT